MTRLTKALIVAWFLAWLVWAFALGRATAQTTYPAQRHLVAAHILPACLAAEDSAAHLKLVDYGDGVARYGCFRKGY